MWRRPLQKRVNQGFTGKNNNGGISKFLNTGKRRDGYPGIHCKGGVEMVLLVEQKKFRGIMIVPLLLFIVGVTIRMGMYHHPSGRVDM
jgi:hypothetical protein